jgi:hypothetical protein
VGTDEIPFLTETNGNLRVKLKGTAGEFAGYITFGVSGLTTAEGTVNVNVATIAALAIVIETPPPSGLFVNGKLHRAGPVGDSGVMTMDLGNNSIVTGRVSAENIRSILVRGASAGTNINWETTFVSDKAPRENGALIQAGG